MSDFARLMEMALEGGSTMGALMGEPPAPLMEQLEANWEAVDKANRAAQHHTHRDHHPTPAPPAPPASTRDKR